MLLLVAVRVCAFLYAYWCQVEELTPPKRPILCDMKEYEDTDNYKRAQLYTLNIHDHTPRASVKSITKVQENLFELNLYEYDLKTYCLYKAFKIHHFIRMKKLELIT